MPTSFFLLDVSGDFVPPWGLMRAKMMSIKFPKIDVVPFALFPPLTGFYIGATGPFLIEENDPLFDLSLHPLRCF